MVSCHPPQRLSNQRNLSLPTKLSGDRVRFKVDSTPTTTSPHPKGEMMEDQQESTAAHPSLLSCWMPIVLLFRVFDDLGPFVDYTSHH